MPRELNERQDCIWPQADLWPAWEKATQALRRTKQEEESMLKNVIAMTALATMAMVTPAMSQSSPPESAKARQIEAMVNKAAALVDREGRAAFAKFRKPNSQWRFGNTYLFAYDTKLNVLLNAAFPKREGRNMHGKKDANGKMMHDEFLKVVRAKGSGWVDYMFPKPGHTRPSRKWSYVKGMKVDGKPGLIGAGFYPK